MAERENTSPSSAGDGLSSILDGILSNPEMMAMISSMAGKLKGSEQNDTEEHTDAAPPSLPEAVGALAPLLAGDAPRQSKRESDRACLLRALKPYLSSGRSEAIDYIIKFSSIADLLKNLS